MQSNGTVYHVPGSAHFKLVKLRDVSDEEATLAKTRTVREANPVLHRVGMVVAG
jgi:hypothetical protein